MATSDMAHSQIVWAQDCTSSSSIAGLKMKTKGRIAVRSEYSAPWKLVAIGSSREMAAAAKPARPTGGVMSAMMPK